MLPAGAGTGLGRCAQAGQRRLVQAGQRAADLAQPPQLALDVEKIVTALHPQSFQNAPRPAAAPHPPFQHRPQQRQKRCGHERHGGGRHEHRRQHHRLGPGRGSEPGGQQLRCRPQYEIVGQKIGGAEEQPGKEPG
ncbi:hypothetical protein SH611_05645 [Geminicoccaceae bacterium 1502E]|nr:hypothetical protein [Geminicoccaceae bacterium 1502E]